MKRKSIGILGATGVVGRQMLKVLEEREFPADKIKLFASGKSAGKRIRFFDDEIEVEETAKDSFKGLDIVLGAAKNPVAKEYAECIKEAGAVFIDNSSAFRMDESVPLIIPEINKEDAFKNNGIIANPNCSTIITLMAVKGINTLSEIVAMNASTYQAVSGAGEGGLSELNAQNKALSENREVECRVFPYQIALNLIPQIGSFYENGYTAEEMKMQNEGRKIMHLPDLKVTCTCVRVPVLRSHSISVSVYTKDRLEIDDVKAQIAKEEGCVLKDDQATNTYPMPLYASDSDLVYVGRIRRDLVCENGITLFCAGDQIRKGAATNAIQIAELFIR